LKKKRKKPSFISKIILLLNIVGALFLLLSYLAPLVSPAKFWPLAFIGLAYPFILIVNIGFILYWVLRLRYHFLISLIVILIGFKQFSYLFQINSNVTKTPKNEVTIKVLSYNVRVFDLYNYGPKWEHRFENRNNIFKYLEENDFDIIMFQEFVHDKSKKFKTQDTLSSILRAKHFHSEFTRSSRDVNFFGMSTFSVYPIVNKGKVLFSTHGGNLCIYTDVLIDKDTVRIYNVHLESIGLGSEDHIFVENMINIVPSDNEDVRVAGRRILSRMKYAYGRRALQVEKMSEHIKQCPYPIILGGDFNDTPSSYVYRQFRKLLTDSFTKRGLGLGQTYVGMVPGFRIDYIMHGDEFETLQYHTGKEEYSDHYPIWALLKKKD
jgi:endonuclease/exonuclease/phosphatase family metal-dependent hydrolase